MMSCTHLDRQALWDGQHSGLAVADVERELLAADAGPVTCAHHLHLLLEASGHAGHHVVGQGPAKEVIEMVSHTAATCSATLLVYCLATTEQKCVCRASCGRSTGQVVIAVSREVLLGVAALVQLDPHLCPRKVPTSARQLAVDATVLKFDH